MKKTYMALAAFLMTAIAFSQGTITGTVVDGDIGGPLPGASIVAGNKAKDAFLAPLTSISPLRAVPPLIINLSK